MNRSKYEQSTKYDCFRREKMALEASRAADSKFSILSTIRVRWLDNGKMPCDVSWTVFLQIIG